MKAVIDTNVLLVANEQHEGVSLDCVETCIKHLRAMQQSGIAVIDDADRILSEYRNKTQPNQPKGVGDGFLKWLLQRMGTHRVEQVSLTEAGEDMFREFPDASLQAEFDSSDRKFVAVAYGHADRPQVWQATDSKWLHWQSRLKAAGVEVKFLCQADVQRFYHGKFPG